MGFRDIQQRQKNNRKAWIAAAIAIVVILVVTLLFNGIFVRFSYGLGGDKLLDVEGEILTTADAYVLLCDSVKQYEEVFSSEVWSEKVGDMTMEEYALEQVRVKLIRLAVLNNIAKEKGIVLSREARNNLNKAAAEYMQGLSVEKIEELGITLEQLERLYERFAVAKSLYEELTEDMKIEVSADEARVISIQYVVSDSQQDAQSALDMVKNGESFAVAVKKYGGSVEGGITVKRSQMVKEFEDCAFELKAGEVSDVISADGKYYVIKCVSDNEKTLSDANRVALINEKKNEEFNKIIEEYERDAFVEFADGKWNKIDINSLPKPKTIFDEIFSKYF